MEHGFTEAADAVLAGIELIRQGAPEAMKAFGGVAVAATATRTMDTKTKELMALAVSIAVHCEGCVAYHARAAFKHGATRQELAETVALAVYMGGGPAAVFGGDAMRAYDEFARGAVTASADATGR
jgi:AhpD family alkylhydroperoxidase